MLLLNSFCCCFLLDFFKYSFFKYSYLFPFLSIGTKKQNLMLGVGIGKGDAHTTGATMTSGITANICVLVLRNNK